MILKCQQCNVEFKTYNKKRKYCSKSCAGIGNIPWNKGLHTEETRKKFGWNRGLTKDTDIRVRNQSESAKGKIPWNKGNISLIEKVCPSCQEIFTQKSYKKKIYCSYVCAIIAQKNRVKKVCLSCKQEFEVPLYRKESSKYCSKECHNKSKIGFIPWNKGKIGYQSHTEQHKAKLRKTLLASGNPNWKGGLSFYPYNINFNRQLKVTIRHRDGYKCQKCGCPEIENRAKLTCHHIDYDKQNCEPFNLISLCKRCNGEVNSNRPHWTEYFTKRVKKIMKSPLQLHLNYEINKKEVVQSQS